MNRRNFLKKSMTTATIITGAGVLLPSCKRDLRSELMGDDHSSKIPNQMDPEVYKILYYASLAPSGHNMQPWNVKIISKTQWIIGVDSERCLPQIDGTTEMNILAIGTFLENLVQAANSFGYGVETTVIGKKNTDRDMVEVRLKKSKKMDIDLQRILFRRTVKSNLLSKELSSSDVDDLSKSAEGNLFYFPTGTEHANFMNESAMEYYIMESNNKKAMENLACWIRFKDKEARKLRDGLTTDGMEITGFAGWYVRNFMDKKDVTTQSFIDQGIEKAKQQVTQGAGWLVITGDGNSVKDLIESGRRFQRMALTARGKMIAIHPMTQTLSEKQGQKHLKEEHEELENNTISHFMLRVGYLDKYPDPVSLRRPVEWFVKS